ncbi:MAG: hypothetical protein J6Y02_10000 [Pseudobutyrivibrio sp.]|nr:hypothetical protein [Pseudobutyrivibrio sp.]
MLDSSKMDPKEIYQMLLDEPNLVCLAAGHEIDEAAMAWNSVIELSMTYQPSAIADFYFKNGDHITGEMTRFFDESPMPQAYGTAYSNAKDAEMIESRIKRGEQDFCNWKFSKETPIMELNVGYATGYPNRGKKRLKR